MDRKTARALNALNRDFYRARAREFSATRAAPWRGWLRVAEHARQVVTPETTVVDVGCGNGRFAAFLADRGLACRYHGVDASRELLELARAQEPPDIEAEYHRADVVESDPEAWLPDAAAGPVALVVLFGVLHHVPGAKRRRRLIEALAARLAPGGLLCFATWRFACFERYRRKLVPRDAFALRTGLPIDARQLEPGDHLLPWGGDGASVRYCHAVAEAEREALLSSLGRPPLGFHVARRFHADGREDSQNDYTILRKGHAVETIRA